MDVYMFKASMKMFERSLFVDASHKLSEIPKCFMQEILFNWGRRREVEWKRYRCNIRKLRMRELAI